MELALSSKYGTRQVSKNTGTGILNKSVNENFL